MRKRRILIILICVFVASWFQTLCDFKDEIIKEKVTMTSINDDGTEEVHTYVVNGDQFVNIDD